MPVVEPEQTFSPDDVARRWRGYVLDKSQWTEAAWETALERKLAVRRVRRNPDGTLGGHFWTLTDAGLDLFIGGA